MISGARKQMVGPRDGGAREQQRFMSQTQTPGGTPAAEQRLPRQRGAGRALLFNGIGLLVLLIIAFAIYSIWHQGYYFYTTDDANVGSAPVSLATTAPGTLQSVSSRQGSTVSAGQTVALVRTTTGATSKIVSPIAGVITNITAAPAALLAPGQPIGQVSNLDRSFITAYVEETHISDIAPGQGVDVKIDTTSSTTFHGTVRSILPVTGGALSPTGANAYANGNYTKVTQRIPVIITLNDATGQTLYPGTSAEVTVHIRQ